jgi:hypothetical protein
MTAGLPAKPPFAEPSKHYPTGQGWLARSATALVV